MLSEDNPPVCQILWWVRSFLNSFGFNCLFIFANVSTFHVIISAKILNLFISAIKCGTKIINRSLKSSGELGSYKTDLYFQIWLCFYFCYCKHFQMLKSAKAWNIFQRQKPLYEILCSIRFLSNTFRFDNVNILADVSIFLAFLYQRKHEMDITQQQQVIWRGLTLL